MKAIWATLLVAASFALASPVAEAAPNADPGGYGDYGDYGGYGKYGDYGKYKPPTPPKGGYGKYADYGKYPREELKKLENPGQNLFIREILPYMDCCDCFHDDKYFSCMKYALLTRCLMSVYIINGVISDIVSPDNVQLLYTSMLYDGLLFPVY
ncbi:hypothetical protein J3E69DRAFT_371998 [Trichoderma sp. SZMC 28015]